MLTNKDKKYLIESVLENLKEDTGQLPSLASQIKNLSRYFTDPNAWAQPGDDEKIKKLIMHIVDKRTRYPTYSTPSAEEMLRLGYISPYDDPYFDQPRGMPLSQAAKRHVLKNNMYNKITPTLDKLDDLELTIRRGINFYKNKFREENWPKIRTFLDSERGNLSADKNDYNEPAPPDSHIDRNKYNW